MTFQKNIFLFLVVIVHRARESVCKSQALVQPHAGDRG